MQVVTPHGFLNRLPRLSPSASASASTLPPLPCLLPLRLRPSPSLFCPALSFASPQPPVYFTLCVALAGVKQLGVSHVEEVPERVGGAMSPMGQRIADWFMPWHARWGTPGEVRKGGAGVVVVGAGCRLWLVGEEQGRGGGGGGWPVCGRYCCCCCLGAAGQMQHAALGASRPSDHPGWLPWCVRCRHRQRRQRPASL